MWSSLLIIQFNPQCIRIYFYIYVCVYIYLGYVHQQSSCGVSLLLHRSKQRHIVSVAAKHSCHIPHLFWIKGGRNEYSASSLCIHLRKVSFKGSAAEVTLSLSATCGHWKQCMCQLCAVWDFSWSKCSLISL